jgi:hypothetical protein
MKYERDGLLLPERNEPQIDEELFVSLEAVLGSGKAVYQQLTLSGDRKAAVLDSWHKGEDANLGAELVEEDDYTLKQAALRQWKQELLARDDLDPDVKQLYRWKVNEHIANVNMLVASSKGDMKNFTRWNEFIYGKPDEDIYRGALDWIAHDAEKMIAEEGQDEAVAEAAQKVLDMLSGKRGYRELLSPEEKTYEEVREDHMRTTGYYGLLLAGVKVPEGKVNREIGDPILQQVLKNIGSNKPVLDATGATWGVTAEGVKRPKEYNMILKRFLGLGLGHEIGSHEIERINGQRGPLAIAQEGLDRYESGNEGRAVIREEVQYETFDEFGKILRWRDIMRRHVAISFASGVGADRPATSSETYDFMNTIDLMYQTKLKPDEPEAAFLAAQKRTDDLLARVLKGTDGKGGAYYKDKVYLEGHVANWLEAATRGPSAIFDGDLGKFDISNPRHVHILQKFNLLPVAE